MTKYFKRTQDHLESQPFNFQIIAVYQNRTLLLHGVVSEMERCHLRQLHITSDNAVTALCKTKKYGPEEFIEITRNEYVQFGSLFLHAEETFPLKAPLKALPL